MGVSVICHGHRSGSVAVKTGLDLRQACGRHMRPEVDTVVLGVSELTWISFPSSTYFRWCGSWTLPCPTFGCRDEIIDMVASAVLFWSNNKSACHRCLPATLQANHNFPLCWIFFFFFPLIRHKVTDWRPLHTKRSPAQRAAFKCQPFSLGTLPYCVCLKSHVSKCKMGVLGKSLFLPSM